MNELVSKVLAAGFTKAVWLDNLKLDCEARIREYCTPEDCPDYGGNWVCPPGCGELAACAAKVGQFDRGVLLQSVAELDPPTVTYEALNLQHNLQLQSFIAALDSKDQEILVLTNGGCVFCASCAYPAPCVKPDMRMNSLSAYGIDVGKLCAMAGLPYSFGPDRVYFVALVLIK